MKKKILTLFVLLTCFISCKYDLVNEPNSGTGGSTVEFSKTIIPPAEVKASNGQKREIVLTWSPVKNAASFQIFSASDAFGNFDQIGETKGNITTFSVVNLEPGISNAFYIKSVSSKGEVSKGSKIFTGTTLDCPIVNLKPESDGKSIEVSWWMGNCTEENYQNDIEYLVSVYNEQEVKLADKDTIVSGDKRSTIISGLAARTNYYFEVSARLKDTNISEVSPRESILSAHQTIPDAPINFTVTKGDSNSEVELSWEMPEAVEYLNKTTKEYLVKPVYFVVERKVHDADDSTYQKIASYIGTTKDTGIVINCSALTSNNANVSLTAGENGTPCTDYPKYISGTKITYKDKTAAKGIKYTYKVNSLTDDVTTQGFDLKNTPVSIDEGWRLAEPTFKVSSEMVLDEEDSNKISSVDVDFNFSLETFGTEYTYVITKAQTEFGQAVQKTPTVVLYTDSQDVINNTKSHFSNLDDSDVYGHYTYKLFIISKTDDIITSQPADYINAVEAVNKVTVTNDTTAIPEIKNFTIRDGFANKFELSWDAVADADYTITWIPYTNGEAGTENTKLLTPADYTVSGNKVNFVHEAISGDSRLYSLNITKSDIPATQVYKEISETLGTAELSAEAPEYKTITVTWPSVQKNNTDYIITANYKKSGASILTNNIDITEENGLVTCTITNPIGYDDITRSGSPIQLKVRATNTETSATTESSIEVCTLGPALIDTKADTKNITDNKLTVTWNQVKGATGYIVYRIKYKYNETNTDWVFDSADSYYYDASLDENKAVGKIINKENDTVDNSRAKIVLTDTVYTLTDYDCEVKNDKSNYEKNQAQIRWGLPYGYVVLPVKGDMTDFTFGSGTNSLKVTGGTADVLYSGVFTAQKTATYGYGLQVQAEKADNTTTQTVTWLAPYFTDKTPTLYRRLAGSENNWKRINPDFTKSGTTITSTYDPKGEDAESIQLKLPFNEEEYLAYEYAVRYGDSTGTPTGTFSNAYTQQLATTMESRSKYSYADESDIEPANKGYLMNIPFKADFGGTLHNKIPVENEYQYSEKVELENWDYENRKIGPDSYEIYIYNTDIGNEWTKVVSSNKNLTSFNKETITDTTIDVDGTIIRLWPTNIKATKAGTSTGPLKVIRDAKHYYKLAMKKESLSEPLVLGDDFNTYGCRDLTTEEISKATMYIVAYAFYRNDGGQESLPASSLTTRYKYGGENNISGFTGTASFTSRSRANSELGLGKFKQYFSMAHYRPELLTPSGRKIVSFIDVSCNQYSAGIRGDADSYIYLFRDIPEFEVNTVDLPISYNCKVQLNCPSDKSITLTVVKESKTNSVSAKNLDGRRSLFPMQMNDDGHYWFKDYGWWN